MTVYVDDMYKHPMGTLGNMKMSHMIATDEEELHEMARKIGVARKWYQGDHYDVAMSKRKKAVENGAVEVTLKQLSSMSALRHFGRDMGDPETAVERMKEVWRSLKNEQSISARTKAPR